MSGARRVFPAKGELEARADRAVGWMILIFFMYKQFNANVKVLQTMSRSE